MPDGPELVRRAGGHHQVVRRLGPPAPPTAGGIGAWLAILGKYPIHLGQLLGGEPAPAVIDVAELPDVVGQHLVLGLHLLGQLQLAQAQEGGALGNSHNRAIWPQTHYLGARCS